MASKGHEDNFELLPTIAFSHILELTSLDTDLYNSFRYTSRVTRPKRWGTSSLFSAWSGLLFLFFLEVLFAQFELNLEE